MAIRRASRVDAAAIRDIHRASIRLICALDYPAAVIDAWHDGSLLSRFEQRIDAQSYWVVEAAGAIVAFGSLGLETSRLESLFVEPSRIGAGIAGQLLAHLEQIALAAGLVDLRLDSSLTAHRFYRRHGYLDQHGGATLLTLGSGLQLMGIPMRKQLARPGADASMVSA